MTPADAACSDCGEPRDPEADRPCPNCGGEKLDYTLRAEPGSYGFEGSPASLVRIREFVERHPGWAALAVGAAVGGLLVTPFLGPVWGAIVGGVFAVVSFVAGRRAERTVREIDRR